MRRAGLTRAATLVTSAFCVLAAAPAQAAPPANDTAAGAIVLSDANPYPLFSPIVQIHDATAVGDAPFPAFCLSPSHAQNQSVWYRFTPSVNDGYELVARRVDVHAWRRTAIAVFTSAGGAAGPFTAHPSGLHRRRAGDRARGPGSR